MANYTVPPIIGTLRLNNGRVATFYESQRDQYERSLASGATPVDPPPADTTTVDGKEVSTTANVPPLANTVTTSESQATPQPATPPTQPGPTSANDDGPTQAPTSGGAGSGTSSSSADSVRPDDNPGSSVSTKNATVTAVDNLFGEGSIVPQANVLDQYASYTYQASVYLMKPETFQQMVKSRKKTLNGTQLLFQSGGAPVGGRNPYFSDDYYIDKIELKSTLQGKGTNAAHNVSTIKMTLIEPNGITLLSNLDRAVEQYLGAASKKQNYASPLYLLVIKFFGYDANGNLVQAGQANGTTNPIGNVPGISGAVVPSTGAAFVEKYYPMAISKLTFKVANKLVEYEILATAPQYQIGVGQSRGTIPYNVELSGMSVKEALAGSAEVGTSTATATRTKQLTEEERQEQDGNGKSPPSAPPTAASAPSPKLTIRKGLMEALNQYQKDLVDQKIYTVADQYSIEFTDSVLEQAKITVPGTDFKNTSPQIAKTAGDQILKEKQAVDPNSRILTITAGQQIVQVIDQAMRNSSYIRSQQTAEVIENTQKQKINGSPGKNVAWFKINLECVPIKWDPKRNDYAYKVKYIISPYRIFTTNSNYFTTPIYRGAQKQYNYWFTGQNTQVLSYEQTYNSLYNYVLSGGNTDVAKTTTAKLTHQPRSGQSSQGADLRTNEPAANLADSLYNPADLGTANLTIVGDPAWLQQGEASFSAPGKDSFIAGAFLPDGTINFDSQQILFEIVINTPTDYDLRTGLMDVNNRSVGQNNIQAKPLNESYVYIANTCTSEFNKGKFTQNLKGTLLQRTTPKSAASDGRSSANTNRNIAGTLPSRTTNAPGTGFGDEEETYTADSKGNTFKDGTLYRAAEVEEFPENQPPASPQPAPPPGDPTSSGDIDFNAGLAGSGESVAAPPNASDAPANNNNIDDQASKAIKNQAAADAATASGDLYAAAYYNNIAKNNRENAAANARSAAKYGVVTTPPQQIARDDA